MKRSLIIALITLAMLAANTAAQRRGPSTLEERKHAVELTNMLENDPLNKRAEDWRRELLTWIIQIPDLTVTICTGMLGDYEKIKGDHKGTLTTQLSFGEIKFLIEHPDEAANEQKVYQAGVESVLKTYQNIKKAKPQVAFEPLEQLLLLQREGKLADFVKNAMESCK